MKKFGKGISILGTYDLCMQIPVCYLTKKHPHNTPKRKNKVTAQMVPVARTKPAQKMEQIPTEPEKVVFEEVVVPQIVSNDTESYLTKSKIINANTRRKNCARLLAKTHTLGIKHGRAEKFNLQNVRPDYSEPNNSLVDFIATTVLIRTIIEVLDINCRCVIVSKAGIAVVDNTISQKEQEEQEEQEEQKEQEEQEEQERACEKAREYLTSVPYFKDKLANEIKAQNEAKKEQRKFETKLEQSLEKWKLSALRNNSSIIYRR